MRFRALLPACSAALCGGLALPALAAAADGEQTPLNLGRDAAAGGAHVGAGGGSLVRTIVGLLVVIAVIYGLTWILRQVKASREAGPEGTGLRSVATLPLGQNRSLHLVRAGEEYVLVGAGEHGVTPIRTYTLAEARALGLLDDPGQGPAADDPFSGDGGGGGPLRRALDGLRRRTVIK
jgi:flagellar protein FliO/FliZ